MADTSPMFDTAHVWSATTGSFYATWMYATYVEAGTWPSDAVAIADDHPLITARSMPPGKRVGRGPDGLPALIDMVAVVSSAPITPSVMDQLQKQIESLQADVEALKKGVA